MLKSVIEIKTEKSIEMISITPEVQAFVLKHKIQNGRINIFVPHTTASITINENADPSVQYDMNKAIAEVFPITLNIMHNEGNSSAHLMSSLMGVSLDLFVENGKLLLGEWQGIYLWEFDGPRLRKYFIIHERSEV